MMIVRTALLTVVCLATVALPAAAQDRQQFDNSWFWGLKAGTLNYSAVDGGSGNAGTFGGDWLITRKRGGLMISYDMANFTVRSSVPDANTSSGRRGVDINDIKRIGAAAMVFPVKYGKFRPYAGIGASLSLLGDITIFADSTAPANEAPPNQAVFDAIDERESQAGMLFIAGAQAEFARLAVFAQGTIVPGAPRFLLNRRPMTAIEFGVRYNIGSSIDRTP